MILKLQTYMDVSNSRDRICLPMISHDTVHFLFFQLLHLHASCIFLILIMIQCIHISYVNFYLFPDTHTASPIWMPKQPLPWEVYVSLERHDFYRGLKVCLLTWRQLGMYILRLFYFTPLYYHFSENMICML